ncbi:protein kinase family protein [Actinomadura kijaniata]|uniref:protein kinase family protein n=1 Tax=Actinomadura kijaniata TaxID=46161 RepID=UPI0008330614|nr:protein kinase family protein [Actinomadura kijaniata]
MSTSVIEPGTRLADRYRLEERIHDAGGSTLWKAVDEILARAVAVRTFDPEFPRIADVITAARTASRLTDPRLTQVFDADDSGENAYVVSEWVSGETLEHMLTKAPLEPGRAATLLYEAAEAIAAAHGAGLTHLCMSPRDLVWTTGGTVKLLGVATDAALRDCASDDPAADDAHGLGAMLYAALTAHWPGAPERSSLPAAPRTDGAVQPPRMVQAGIAHGINDIVCRSLGLTDDDPITTPADLAAALRGVPRTPLPLFAGLGTPPPPRRPAPPRQQAPTRPTPQPSQQTTHQHHVPSPPLPPQHAPARRKSTSKALLGAAAAALTVIAGLGAWALTGDDGNTPPVNNNKAGVTDPKKSASPQPAVLLPIQNARSVDELWVGKEHDEAMNRVSNPIKDGRYKADWHTQTYRDVRFGNLLKGAGVLLDMGRSVKIANVKVTTPESGASLQLKVGDSDALGSLRTVGKGTSSAGTFTLEAREQTQGRYVLVWFAELPPSCKARLSEITVHGQAQ